MESTSLNLHPGRQGTTVLETAAAAAHRPGKNARPLPRARMPVTADSAARAPKDACLAKQAMHSSSALEHRWRLQKAEGCTIVFVFVFVLR